MIIIESYDILEASINRRGDKVDGTVIDIRGDCAYAQLVTHLEPKASLVKPFATSS